MATTGNGPISDSDKQTLKHNLRKQDLYEQAYYFCDNLFEMGQVGESMTTDQLIEFTASVLSIVLSHHFQKEDIKKMTRGTSVDF